MKAMWMRVSFVAAGVVAAAVVLGTNLSQTPQGDRTAAKPPVSASAPATCTCDMKTCHEHAAKLDQVAQALAEARKAADSGDAKAASAAIEKASVNVRELQESMKTMMGKMAGTAASAPAVAAVNFRCPIMGKAIDRANVPERLTRMYKGQKVGFCCGGCPAAWDALSDADKDKKLAECMKPQ